MPDMDREVWSVEFDAKESGQYFPQIRFKATDENFGGWLSNGLDPRQGLCLPVFQLAIVPEVEGPIICIYILRDVEDVEGCILNVKIAASARS